MNSEPPPGRPDAFGTRLQTVTERELLLAPYATFSAQSQGRRYPEPDHPYRGPFQRDRDRIVHSAAYRRLSGKTQVFMGELGDYHRTRLTHTYEVASIARTMARALRLNEDLVEALALFHDIGHPPYGHAGEDALNECLADDGGFSHNRFALTLAEELESRYPGFPGLNLSLEVLAGQRERTSKLDRTLSADRSSLEAQVVDLADSITYDAHDFDDAVKLGLVTIEQLLEVPLVREAADQARARHGNISGKLLRMAIVHELIDLQVGDALDHARQVLRVLEHDMHRTLSEAHPSVRLGHSIAIAERKRVLEDFLYQNVYRHPRLLAVRAVAQARLRSMFDLLTQNPERLPVRFRERAKNVGWNRSVGDYLAGMTDRYCDAVHQRLLGYGTDSGPGCGPTSPR
ncbi:MAG: dNTP triphosphohydrolase [Planctomycetes bacterium]|nr:dNTP triphosphohydrolase [Planctomycetota bacterium]